MKICTIFFLKRIIIIGLHQESYMTQKDMCVWGLRTGISGPFTQYDENAQFSPLHTADSEGALEHIIVGLFH